LAREGGALKGPTDNHDARGPTARPIKVLIVADTLLYREGLVVLLGTADRLKPVGSASDPGHVTATVARERPDVVLLDVAAAYYLRTLRAIVETSPATPVVAFGHTDSEEQVIACAEAGVAGYVSREATMQELVRVVEGVLRDEVVCSPRLAATLLRRVGTLARERSCDGPERRLTSRETQIVALLDEGLSNKAIAARLNIELATVKNHVHHILEKLEVGCRAEAVARVRALGAERVPI
jgi:two-component system, NarL family, nitrate/nitrite response regulator NarL